jgi:toxin ParE1/3/4
MSFRYKLSQEAKEDLQRIYEYGYLNFGEQQADDYFNGFFETFDKIAAHPFQHQTVDNIRIGYRRYPYHTDTIYYRINNQQIEIMAILGGQDIDVWI